MLTGESLPVSKRAGDRVAGATRNGDGTLLIEAGRLGRESALEGIVRLVREAQSSKAGVQRLADAISARFVPAVLGVALITLLGWGVFGHDWGQAVLNAAAVLIIACPCALGLATPMAVAVATGRGARAGLLVREASAFERMDRLNTVVFDKTGHHHRRKAGRGRGLHSRRLRPRTPAPPGRGGRVGKRAPPRPRPGRISRVGEGQGLPSRSRWRGRRQG